MPHPKVALVTGGSRGIGRAVCVEFGRVGYHVLINYKSNAQAAQETLLFIQQQGGSGELLCCDVADHRQTQEALAEALGREPNIAVLVNNAGVTADGLLALMSEEDWDGVIATSLKGFFNVTKPIVKKMMKNKRGAVVSIASVAAALPQRGQANYCAAKAGIIAASRALAKEVAPFGVRINTVSPGAIATEMLGGISHEILTQMIPLARVGTPTEVAKMVLFLCSEDASYITGQDIAVNGGMF